MTRTREAGDGFDGSWVAHPGMVALCTEVFDSVLGDKPNQIDKPRDDVSVTAARAARRGVDSRRGHRGRASQQHQRGCAVPRDLATRVWSSGHQQHRWRMRRPLRSRSQVWQWLHTSVELSDGQTVSRDVVEQLIAEEIDEIQHSMGEQRFGEGRWDDARALFTEMALAEEFADFLTLPAYEKMP